MSNKVLYSGNKPAIRTKLGEYLPMKKREVGRHTFARQDKLRERILGRKNRGGVKPEDQVHFYMTGNASLRNHLRAQNRNPHVFRKMANSAKAIRLNRGYEWLMQFFDRGIKNVERNQGRK